MTQWNWEVTSPVGEGKEGKPTSAGLFQKSEMNLLSRAEVIPMSSTKDNAVTVEIQGYLQHYQLLKHRLRQICLHYVHARNYFSDSDPDPREKSLTCTANRCGWAFHTMSRVNQRWKSPASEHHCHKGRSGKLWQSLPFKISHHSPIDSSKRS
jgi:hypothetical protein